ncbi:hypothetical protein CEP53_005306 [Fusarium sp. AF-6]|nr:hypothetical protein CEP53_005306 [Fusarium sp. AF-6]
MPTQQPSEPAGLANLPYDIHLEIFSYLCPMGEALGFVTTCGRIYNNLIVEYYKVYGSRLNWLPLLFGITEWKEAVLERCLKAGAPLDYRWPYIDRRTAGSDARRPCKSCSALDWARWSGQRESEKWLINNRAADTQKQLPRVKPDSSIKILEARWLVFAVRTSMTQVRPVLYQREVHRPDVYPYEPYRRSAHLVWYGPKIKPCRVFPRLRDILKAHCDAGAREKALGIDSNFALWISRFWLDMLLSSSDCGPIFESGFFESIWLRDGKYHGEMGRDVVFGKASLISNMMDHVRDPEFGRHFSPSIFRLLLDSRADISLIASAYVSIFKNLFSYRRQKVEYIPTFRFYPLILRQLIDSGADMNAIENFRFQSSVPLLSSASSEELPGVLSEALGEMADCNASPDEMVFAFSLFARRLLRCGQQQSLSSFPLVQDLATRLGA